MGCLRVGSVVVASVLVLSACGGATPTGRTGTRTDRSITPGEAITDKDFDPQNFDHSTDVQNRWLPLQPGTKFVFAGYVNEGTKRLPHRVVFIVTDLTKVINGVRTVVIYDRDYISGQLVEAELAFHAQDNDGNVWNLGEYPEEYEEGQLVGAENTWIAGVAGARPGVLMRVDPRVGTSSYLQGWAPEIHFGDIAKVLKTSQKNCVPLGCYENVLVIDESDPAEPTAHQLKYYVAGLGNIRVGFAGSDTQKEGLALVSVDHLSSKLLAEVRGEALKLERRAYRVSKDLYGHTSPAEQTLQA